MKIWKKLCLLSLINYKTPWGTKIAFLLSQIFIALSPILALWERQQDTRHGFGASLVFQLVKNLPAVQETQVWSLGWEDPLEKEMATHSSILAGILSWPEGPGRLQSVGSQRVRRDWACRHALIQKQTHRSMKQDREPRDKSMYPWSINTWQKRQEHTMETGSCSKQ